ncbi:MAG: SfnB family sulfur acquisition oxidoreductase, partial [Mesorhizobium sp.]
MTVSNVKTDKAAAAVPPVPRPATAAHIIKHDAEAIAVAHRLAAEFVKDSSKRDRERIWPVAELDQFSQS